MFLLYILIIERIKPLFTFQTMKKGENIYGQVLRSSKKGQENL
jgi:hypothetical protein